jgi:hypothetical protein
MTIKPLGGVFGRNPTFNNVTVDGTLTSSSISISSLDNVPIGSTTPSTGDFTDLTVTQEFELQMGANAFGAETSSGYILRTGALGSAPFTQAGALVYQPRSSTTDGRSNHKFYTGSPLTLALDLKPDQNAHFGGNAVFASGKGIDFSATGGTGTSELLDDYEEGTFTHATTCSTSGTLSVAGAYDTGSYVKVGNKVTAQGLIIMSAISSPVGVLNISLPFLAANGSEREFDTAATVVINNSVGNTAGSYVAYVVSNTQTIQVLEGDAASFGSLSANQIQASSTIWYNVTYRAA